MSSLDSDGVVMAIGLLESFELSEEFGSRVLTFEELTFMKDAYQRKGCRMQSSRLTHDEIDRVLLLGRKCKEWKEKFKR